MTLPVHPLRVLPASVAAVAGGFIDAELNRKKTATRNQIVGGDPMSKLGPIAERREGSTPSPCTILKKK